MTVASHRKFVVRDFEQQPRARIKATVGQCGDVDISMIERASIRGALKDQGPLIKQLVTGSD